ncbi:MAG: hypothetical protein EXR71_13795 [Myxococcales bacterium]|nr:hypothetical protein [Myxococcales bacterium]
MRFIPTRGRPSATRSVAANEESWQTQMLDGYFALIDPSTQRDWDTWGPTYRSYDGGAGHRGEQADWTDYEGGEGVCLPVGGGPQAQAVPAPVSTGCGQPGTASSSGKNLYITTSARPR